MRGQPRLLTDEIAFAFSLTADQQRQARNSNRQLQQVAEERHSIKTPNHSRPGQAVDLYTCAPPFRRAPQVCQHIDLVEMTAAEFFKISVETLVVWFAFH